MWLDILSASEGAGRAAMFHKVIFTRSGFGSTAGLVLDGTKHDVRDVAAVSRLFPYSAAVYMRTYHVSPAYATWGEAFGHVFPFDVEGN
jgi:hypothetical protein